MTECTIEEILGMSLDKMTMLTPAEWEAYLAPHIVKQEQIFQEIKRPAAIRSVSAGHGPRLESIDAATARLRKGGGDAAALLTKGLTPQEATLQLMMNSGVKLTPEMLEMLKNKKNK